jgi:hypothetical protein
MPTINHRAAAFAIASLFVTWAQDAQGGAVDLAHFLVSKAPLTEEAVY